MPRGGLKEEQLSKEGSRYFSYRDPEDFSFDFTKSRPWTENGRIERHVPCGVWKSPMYLNPSVYPNRNVLRFPTRPQTGKNVRWGEFKGKPQFVEKCVDSLEKTFDARDKFATRRPPQYTIKPQKVDKPGPCFHRALHKAVASGDKNVSNRRSLLTFLASLHRKLSGLIIAYFLSVGNSKGSCEVGTPQIIFPLNNYLPRRKC